MELSAWLSSTSFLRVVSCTRSCRVSRDTSLLLFMDQQTLGWDSGQWLSLLPVSVSGLWAFSQPSMYTKHSMYVCSRGLLSSWFWYAPQAMLLIW